jgi:hypothetical protein
MGALQHAPSILKLRVIKVNMLHPVIHASQLTMSKSTTCPSLY